jgi:selenide,water dikinase
VAREFRPRAAVTLISAFPVHHYSGMVPGYLQGHYAEPMLRFDLRALAARAGARFVEGAGGRLRLAERCVELDGERISFDLLSVNIGSEPAGLETPGVREHAFTVRPMTRAVALRQRLDVLAADAAGRRLDVVVVGGGAAGVEVALAIHRRLAQAGVKPRVTLCDASETLLSEFDERVRTHVRRLAAGRRLVLRPSARVVRVSGAGVTLAAGDTIPATLVVWLTGATGPTVLREAALPTDARGFLLVDDTLRAVDGSPVWGAGDAVTLASRPALARAGVYAVREAPILAANLYATIAGTAPVSYRPQRSFLAILNTADGKALLRWRHVVSHSRAAWYLKDRIDRRFVRRHQLAPFAQEVAWRPARTERGA